MPLRGWLLLLLPGPEDIILIAARAARELQEAALLSMCGSIGWLSPEREGLGLSCMRVIGDGERRSRGGLACGLAGLDLPGTHMVLYEIFSGIVRTLWGTS
jgi:uncharacterized protein YceK